MGLCISAAQKQQKSRSQKAIKQQAALKSNIQSSDVVKVKLKHCRDRIKTFISQKNNDIAVINQQIKQKVPEFQQTGNKKPLVPLLQARLNLQKQISQAQTKLKLINQSIDQVQMSKMNADMVNVLDESNKYVKEIHEELEKKDWRNILDEAQKKYEIQWPDDSEQIQEDPQFLAMWKQIGGQKVVQKKSVNVNVATQKQKNPSNKQRQVELA